MVSMDKGDVKWMICWVTSLKPYIQFRFIEEGRHEQQEREN
jgi:hypothetical protein